MQICAGSTALQFNCSAFRQFIKSTRYEVTEVTTPFALSRRKFFGGMAEFIPAKYVPAKRNNGKLLVDNNHFVYNMVKKREKKTYWGCQKKTSLGCKVTATVLCKLDENGEPDDEIVDIHGNHSHDSDLMLEASKKALDDGIELAKQDLNISPRSICANI